MAADIENVDKSLKIEVIEHIERGKQAAYVEA